MRSDIAPETRQRLRRQTRRTLAWLLIPSILAAVLFSVSTHAVWCGVLLSVMIFMPLWGLGMLMFAGGSGASGPGGGTSGMPPGGGWYPQVTRPVRYNDPRAQ